MKTALIAGASGLIGEQLLGLLLENEKYDKVIAVVRRGIATHPKLEQFTIDLGNEKDYEGIKADDVFCCLGTTIAKAGSKDNFRKVDFQYPLVLAESMKRNGAKQYLIVTALGASKKSSIFYNQVKGEVEEAVSKIDFESIHIFRPSLLIGERKEKRPGEDAAKWVYTVFGFLFPSKYKGISVTKIARAMLTFASEHEHGIFIHESNVLQKY
ncbi:MAG: NAD-dependent epimerase/dehydratase family protein [Chryseolinea sp.]